MTLWGAPIQVAQRMRMPEAAGISLTVLNGGGLAQLESRDQVVPELAQGREGSCRPHLGRVRRSSLTPCAAPPLLPARLRPTGSLFLRRGPQPEGTIGDSQRSLPIGQFHL